MISQTYDLNLIPSQIPVTIHCSQYDDGSRTFVFNLYEGASAFELPVGASATFSGVKPDGLGFQYNCTITGASQVSVDVELQMTAVAGDCPCKVTVYDTDSNVLGSALCVLDVERHPLQDDTVISDSDIPLVQEAVNWAAQFQPSNFVTKNQGVAQAGKFLGIGNDGMVTPVAGGGGSADTITYDNTTSGLAATDVQNAIDEVDNAVDGLKSQVSTLIGETSKYYNITDSADTTVDDADYVPFYDTSASAKKKITWANIITKVGAEVTIREQRCIDEGIDGIEWELDDLMTLVRNGEFDKFAIGDSFVDGSTHWRIHSKKFFPKWAFDGTTGEAPNHIVCIPDEALGTHAYNTSNTNSGGYAGSTMPSYLESTILPQLSVDLRSYILQTKIYENNKGAWAVMQRNMRIPTIVECTGNQGWADQFSSGISSQLPLMRAMRHRVKSYWYWCLDPSASNATSFCYININGLSHHDVASNSSGSIRAEIVLG